jgi:copper resistance protein B
VIMKTALAAMLLGGAIPVAAQTPIQPISELRDPKHITQSNDPALPPLDQQMNTIIPARDRKPASTTLPDLKRRAGWPKPIDDAALHRLIVVDLLEYQPGRVGDQFRWDVYGWYGGDRNRLWIKTEGVQRVQSGDGEQELQILYGRLIAPFFDLQAGGRVATRRSIVGRQTRTYASLGLQGIAPYLFEIEPVIFLSDRGKLSGRFNVSYELLLTQRLILQPRLDTEFAFSADRAFAVGAGLGSVETGLRLRYEIRREIAPYIGVTYRKTAGQTRRLLRAEGEPLERTALVAGVRLWF